jgi:RNA polymerase sigma-70 factor (ECF subfamily)
MMPNEPGLIDRAINGDKEAFTSLVRRYQNRIFAFIMRMTADRETALDLTQDTFLAAYQNLSGFRKEASFSTWLYQIAANRTRNYMKKSSREVPLVEGYDKASNKERPDTEFERKELESKLLGAIAVLPYKQRLTFNLRYFDQLKFHEIAGIMGVSVSATKTNFAEALAKLKKRLGH